MSPKSSNNQRKISFATPLIILFVVVLFVAFSFQAVFVSSRMAKEIKATQRENLVQITQSMSDLVDLELKANENQLIAYAEAIGLTMGAPIPEEEKGKTLTNLLKEITVSNEYYETIFIAGAEGTILYSPEESVIGADISDREYFNAIIQNGRNSTTTKKAIQSKATGNLTIVHAVPIFENHKRVGLLAASLNLTSFGNKMILSKTIGETGYPYIMDKDGMLLVHPSEALVATQAQDVDPFLQEIVDNGQSLTYASYSLNGEAKQGVFIRMMKSGWLVCMAIDDAEAFHSITSLRLMLVIISVLLLAGTSLILFFYVRVRLIRKLRLIERILFQASEGDLTERSSVRGRDEVAGMAGYFNTLLDSLSDFFITLRGNLQELDEVGLDLSSNMEETAAAVHQIKTNVENSLGQIEKQEQSVSTTVTVAEEITQNIESLDRNIERQDVAIQQGSSAVEEMIAQIKTVSASTEEAENLMTVLNESSSRGRDNLQNVSSQVRDIEEKSQDLEKANALIAGIAAQTNLLAMNAAIEAAHAGDAGRGFAVVADEIRKLAEQSTTQSGQVKQSISNISASIQEVVRGSASSNHSFEDIMENMKKMAEITAEIKSSMQEQVAGSTQVLQTLDELKNSGQEVSAGSREMTAGNKEILQAVEALTQISSEVSMAIREIGNGMDEISSSVLNVTDIAGKNKTSIDLVQREAARYRLEGDPGENAESRPEAQIEVGPGKEINALEEL